MHLLRRRGVAVALALTTVLAGACTKYDNGNNTLTEGGGTPTPAGDPRTTRPAENPPGGTVALEAKDNAFEPKTIEAPAGAINIEMKNTGAAPHTFTSADLAVDVNADAGKTATINLKDVKPGTYKIICKYHEALGMVGELKVT
ncbi:MAG TPA: cupredoxin domain-containing protein [Mycobacteriales bacterium]|jgi:plastocyanin